MISQGNHIKFARFVFLAISEEAETSFFLFHQCIIKQLLGLGKGYQPRPSAWAYNPYMYLDLDYSGYHKNLIQW